MSGHVSAMEHCHADVIALVYELNGGDFTLDQPEADGFAARLRGIVETHGAVDVTATALVGSADNSGAAVLFNGPTGGEGHIVLSLMRQGDRVKAFADWDVGCLSGEAVPS